MSMIVSCVKTKGYQWYSNNKIYFKGYLQLENSKVFRGEEAIAYLEGFTNFSDFKAMLKHNMGCFSIIINNHNCVWAAVDIARSMPLYYSDNLDMISDSAEAIRKKKRMNHRQTNTTRALEMYATSYISDENTIYDSIKQIHIGNAIEIKNGRLKKEPYFIHYEKTKEYTYNEAKNILYEKTAHMLERMLKVIDGRPIVISLSGGYDSRYLVCSLKKYGVKNVICYTYGKENSFEIKQSKLVADALGYEWHQVEYDKSDIKSILKNGEEYFAYCNEHDYIVYIQNYLAVKTLSEKRLIPKDAVFLTGLCNDMPTGFYTPDREKVSSYGCSIDGAARFIVESKFIRVNLKKEMQLIYQNEIKDRIDRLHLEINGYQDFVAITDCINTEDSHSRCFLNMNKIHEYFGYEWLLPCWDKELLSFWYSLPAKLRYKQNLYEDYILNNLANEYGVGVKKYIRNSTLPSSIRALKRYMGGLLIRICYPIGIPMNRKYDINNFASLEIVLYKRIVQKKAINPQHAALTMLLTVYIMEQRYGTDWYCLIKKYLL